MVQEEVNDAAVEELQNAARAVEVAVARLRDGIDGQWGEPNGGVYVTDIAAATQSALLSLGRLANTLDKASTQIVRRAGDAYLDFAGEQTDVTEEVRAIGERVGQAGAELAALHSHYYPLVSELASLGQR